MRIFYFILVVVIGTLNIINYVQASASASCPQLVCAEEFGICGYDGLTQKLCPPGLQYCNSNGVCANYLLENEICSPSGPASQCGPLSCQSSPSGKAYICLPALLKSEPGEPCTSDSQCYYQDPLSQNTNSTCVKGSCYGLNLGDACTSNSGQCVAGLYCSSNSGVCTALGSNGAVCDSGFECATGSCVPQAVNQTVVMTCGNFQSVEEGGLCATTNDCENGYYCSEVAYGKKYGSCTEAVASSYSNCTSDDDCAFPQTCTCDYTSGSMYCMAPPAIPKDLLAAETAQSFCSKKYNCSDGDDNCVLENCATELCAYNSLMYGPTVWNDNILNLNCIYGDIVVNAYKICNGNNNNDGDSSSNNDSNSNNTTTSSSNNNTSSEPVSITSDAYRVIVMCLPIITLITLFAL